MRNLWRGEEAGRVRLATRSLAPGTRAYNEELLKIGGEEYRTWDPYRSKLAAALVKGFPDGVIQEGERVLYLSDLIGERGLLIGVEFAPRVAREFIERVARVRGNVIPYVADAREPDAYSTIGRVDLVYCDIAQQDQTEIAIQNCRVHLRTGGSLMLVVKSRSIDVVREPEEIFREERKKLEEAGFEVIQVVGLEPFEKDHAMILARFRG